MQVSSVLLTSLRQYALQQIAGVRYISDGQAHDAAISKREILTNGLVAVYFSIAHEQSGAETITQVQVLDENQGVLAEDETDIQRLDGTEAIYCQVRLSITAE